MADIELVVKIDEEEYMLIKQKMQMDLGGVPSEAERIIANGTPLSKGHGRLIDADYLKDVSLLHNFHGNNKNIVPYADRRGYRLRQREVDEAIINAPTIIEADKESEDA